MRTLKRWLEWWKKRESVKAVEESDFIPYLKKLGVYEDILQKKARCAFCGKIVSINSIAGLFSDGKSIKFFCYEKNCMNRLISSRKQEKP